MKFEYSFSVSKSFLLSIIGLLNMIGYKKYTAQSLATFGDEAYINFHIDIAPLIVGNLVPFFTDLKIIIKKHEAALKKAASVLHDSVTIESSSGGIPDKSVLDDLIRNGLSQKDTVVHKTKEGNNGMNEYMEKHNLKY